MSEENTVEEVLYRMEGDTEIERLHNRLNPPGTLGLAAQAFGGMSNGYYAMEDYLGQVNKDDLSDPAIVAKILSTDTDQALSALRLLDSCETFTEHPIDTDLLSIEVSQEDLVQNSLKALKTILKWTKQAAQSTFDEMTSYEVVSRYLEFTAENLRVTSRDRRNSTQFSNKPLKVDTRIANLSIRYEPIKDIAALTMALRVLTQLTKEYFTYNGEELSRVAERIPQLVGNPEQLAATLSQVSPSKLARSTAFKPAQAGDATYLSPHLLGCHRVSIKTQDTAGLLGRRYSIRLVPSDVIPRPLPTSIEFKRFPLNAQDNVLRQVSELAKYLQSVNTILTRQRRMARVEKVAIVVQKLSREIESGQFDSARHREVIALINQYNDWVNNPYKELYGLVCRNLRAVLNLCEINAM